MFRLEKIFQQDDFFFINIVKLIKGFLIFLSIYIFSILEFNSIFDLLNYNIYKESKYFYLSIYFPIIYFLFLSMVQTIKKKYVTNFSNFWLSDIIPLFITLPFSLYVFFIFKIDFNIDINILYLLILITCNLLILRKFLLVLYNNLMNNNLIQRNIMLVGSIESIEKILKEKKDTIHIYKCCVTKTDATNTIEKARMILKIPVFTEIAEMRLILEYHELGQIWILDNNEGKNFINYFIDLLIRFPVDIIIINLKDSLKNNLNLPPSENLINNKYSYSNYQTSRFYGFNLLIKILMDKILTLVILLLLSPICVLAMIFIFIEDGFPIFDSEESAGWDGRRFNVHKLRIYKKNQLDKTVIVNKNKEHLKIGKIIRRLHIDEFPQFLNILKGDMSIVGPRPHILKEDLAYAKVFRQFLKRNKTSPGLTGWAQVNGFRGHNPSNDNMKKRMEHDLWYMNNWSIWLDVYIILKTVLIFFSKPNK
jgi:lipopolysaccharide/colanic/teichoic acid biosynthesis glycosyltransferase